jgi:xanthine dehydrogenase YagR molybdenum-binding subunit
MTGLIGRGVERVDGRAKVTGAARYAADNEIAGVLHGFLVQSTVARGEIVELDTSAALACPGVVAVYTHENMLALSVPPAFPYPKSFVPLQDNRIHHNGQPVAYVVAETLEQAQEAATLVRVRYRAQRPTARLVDALDEVFLPDKFRDRPNEHSRGDAEAALERAEVRLEREYTSTMQHHNPIEPHTTTAVWDGDSLTLYESAQGVVLSRRIVTEAFETVKELGNVRVVSPYLGGGFGAKGPTWPHTLLTAAVARLLGRPVKLVLTRAQMYTMNGHRAEYRRSLRLGATRQGRLTAIVDTSTAQLTRTEHNIYNASDSTLHLYACPNVHVRQLGVRLDLPTSSYMRSPETTAHFGLETAMDELSYEVGIDPVELRIRNHSTVDPHPPGRPYQGKHLLDCYRIAARAFGWERRDARPGSMRDGDELVGWGMATEMHTYFVMPSSAELTIGVDGRATLRTASQEIGTGTYTVLTQVVADGLGMPLEQVTTMLGDTAFPPATISAGSSTVPSVVGPVARAARNARGAVVAIAVADPRSPLFGVSSAEVVIERGRLFARGDRGRGESYRDVLSRHGGPVRVTENDQNMTGRHTFGAVFVEVRVQPRLAAVRVSRVVAAYDVGKVLNHRTALGQVTGGVTWGIGFALMEHTVVDRNTARVVNPNLSGYLVPVNADTPTVEAYFIDRPDLERQEAHGARGFGETPGTGVPAAISNAIFHATGRRLRDVPFTQDKLL